MQHKYQESNQICVSITKNNASLLGLSQFGQLKHDTAANEQLSINSAGF